MFASEVPHSTRRRIDSATLDYAHMSMAVQLCLREFGVGERRFDVEVIGTESHPSPAQPSRAAPVALAASPGGARPRAAGGLSIRRGWQSAPQFVRGHSNARDPG